MESTNFQEEEYHHQQQQHLQNEQLTIGSSNSSLGSPCFSSVGTNHHAWRTSNFLLNINNNIHANCEEEAATGTTNSLTNSMIQNMGFAWGNPSSINDDQQSLVSKKIIKQECSSTSSSSDHHHPPQNKHNNSSSSSNFAADMLSPPTTTSACELLLLNTLSPHPMLANRDLLQLSALHHHQGGHEGVTSTNFSQIFPSVNISSLGNNNNNNNNGRNMSELVSSSGTMEMSHDLQGGLDAFAAARLLNGGSLIISQGVDPSNSHLELFKFERNHRHHLLQSSDLKLWNTANNLSSFNNNGVLESKRTSCIMEPKSTDDHDNQMVSKKPRFESRSSCPPFKVRKEKLGDRIAALQQLVAPFGKTDTASVLMEAFGYIKFLQNQVETLSVPYMKLSSRNKQLSTKNTERVSGGYGESDEDQKLDLKSRGLCLVPVSCMTYLASDGCNGSLWPPHSFHPGF